MSVIEFIENFAPPEFAEPWDNSGWQLRCTPGPYKKVLVALEITDAVVQEALTRQCDLVVVHHPLIFQPLKQIVAEAPVGRQLLALMAGNISVYAAHTNLDATAGGLNDYCCALLGVQVTGVITPPAGNSRGLTPAGMGRFGILESPLSTEVFLERVQQAFGLEQLQYTASGIRQIQKVGLCAGAGSGFIAAAKDAGCDFYLTGDIKYHDYRLAEALGIGVGDITHFGSENPYMAHFARLMAEHGVEAEIVLSKLSGASTWHRL